jgi:hypothetical protein
MSKGEPNRAVEGGRATGGALCAFLLLVSALNGAGCDDPRRGLELVPSMDVSSSGSAQGSTAGHPATSTPNAAGPNTGTAGGRDAGSAEATRGAGESSAQSAASNAGSSPAIAGTVGSETPATGSISVDAGIVNGADAGITKPPGVSLDEFCSILQTRARTWLRECRVGFGDSRSWWGTENIDGFCSAGRAAIAAGRLAFNPLQAEACVARSVNGCEEIEAFQYGVRSTADTSPCRGVVVGAQPQGGQCYAESTHYASECAEGYCGGGTCPSTCTAYAQDGQACNQTSPCSLGSFCNANNKCERQLKLGADCTAGLCETNLSCAHETQPTPLCVLKRSLGEACQWTSECPSNSECYQNKCVADLPVGAPQCSSIGCEVGLDCADVCTPRLAVGAACTSVGVSCVEGARCLEGQCRPFSQVGGICPCASGLWCDVNNVCREKSKLGIECSGGNSRDVVSPCEAPLLCRATVLEQGAFTKFVCSGPGNQGDLCQNTPVCKWPLFCDPTTSRCQPAAPKDAACNPALALDSCQAGLYCQCTLGNCPAELCTGGNCSLGPTEAGACRPQAALDEPCTGSAGCTSRNCVDQKCAPSSVCK